MKFFLFIIGIFLFNPLLAVDVEKISPKSARKPAISGDGRLVMFQSKYALTQDDMNREWDVYLYDRSNKQLQKISQDHLGASNGGSAISSDGRVMAYHSYPLSVVKGKPPRRANIILYDQKKDEFKIITKGFQGQEHDGESVNPSLNKKGDRVAFTSNATNFLVEKKNAFQAVYLYDNDAYRVSLASISKGKKPTDRPSIQAEIDFNGRYIVFRSAATNLEPPLPKRSLGFHLYLFDTDKQRTVRIDDVSNGFDSGNWIVGGFSLSSGADFVVFEALKRKNTKPLEQLKSSHLFIFNRKEEQIEELLPGQFDGSIHSPSLSANGRYVVFVFEGLEEGEGGLMIYDRKKQRLETLLDGQCDNPSISANGDVIVFESNNSELTKEKKKDHIFVVQNPFE